MARIKKQWEEGMVEGWKSIILEADTEVETLPIAIVDATKTTLQGYNKLSVGSEAFCPSTGNAFVLTEAGWIKIT